LTAPANRGVVWRDDSGIGGFFEDLPVLAFVLGGVILLISSSVWSAQVGSAVEARETLEAVADELVQCVLLTPFDGTLSLDRLTSVCLSAARESPARCEGFVLNASVVYPYSLVVATVDVGEAFEHCDDIAYAAGVVNAVDEFRLTVIVEVRVLVW
jgi:hypothetical protein